MSAHGRLPRLHGGWTTTGTDDQINVTLRYISPPTLGGDGTV